MTTTEQVLTSQELIDKIGRRARETRELADRLRRLAKFDEEIRDALIAFKAAGGVDESAPPGGHRDGKGSDQTATD